MSSFILFLQAFSIGILAPVLSLTLLSKGISMTGLALIMGMYSLTAVSLELPSGILADFFGRKKTFLMAQIATACSIICILSGTLLFVCAGMVLLGMGRALSSGTLDAFYIDQMSKTIGMEKTVSRVNLLDGVGLAAGAIVGGFLPVMSDRIFDGANIYNAGLILRLILTAFITVLTGLYIKEIREESEEIQLTLKTHLKEGMDLITGSRLLQLIFLSVFATGFLLFSIETYWQPAFTLLPSSGEYLWLLGIISFLFFGASSVGILIAEYLTKFFRISPKLFYIVARLLLSGAVVGLACSRIIPLFIVFLITQYLFFGMSNLLEGILINKAIPSNKRSSILSLSSLIMQSGGFAGSLLSSILVAKASVWTIWVLGVIMVVGSAVVLVYKDSAQNKTGFDVDK